MTRYDPEIIAALAEGTLDPQEAEALERAINADPAASGELAAQRLAIETMREAPAPMLTEAERTDLRRRVASELGLTPAPAPAPAPRRIAWGSIAVAAAALAGVVAIVPVVGLLTTSGDSEDAAAVSLDEATSRATARAGTAQAPAAVPEASEQTAADLSSATTSAATTFSADGSSETTGAGETTTSAVTVTTTAPATTGPVERESTVWLSGWRESDADPHSASEAGPTVPCFEHADAELAESGGDELLTEPAEYSETAAITFYLLDETGEVGPIAAFVTETCELIAQLD